MEELYVTWGRAARIWWSIAWRNTLWCMLSGLVIGVLVGMLTPVESREFYVRLVALPVGIFISIFIIKMVLEKNFNGYRIALIKCNTVSEE